MRIPTIRGLIERRILVNCRVDPAAAAAVLPPPFRPELVRGWAVAGVCLIRLKHIRPAFLPAALGVASENAAHRIAVEWHDAGKLREGVFIPRRDTSSRLNAWAGGRVFPGAHHHATFRVDETESRYRIDVVSDDRRTALALDARDADTLPCDSIFESLGHASAFFEAGSLGYSPAGAPQCFDGLELRCSEWSVRPLAVDRFESSWFGDQRRFPAGSVKLDNALLMANVKHEWLARPAIGDW